MVTFITSTLVDRYLFLNIVLVMIQEIGLIYIVKNIEQFNHFKYRFLINAFCLNDLPHYSKGVRFAT